MLGSQQQHGSDRSQHFFRSKKRTGLGPHPLPGLGSETAVLDSFAECLEANSSRVPTVVSTSSGPKKRTGFGPHPLPGLGSETAVLDSLAECVKANASQGSERSQHLLRPKKRTGLGPHPCPQIRGVSKDFRGYVRSSEVILAGRLRGGGRGLTTPRRIPS
jgi:hypothetical protein